MCIEDITLEGNIVDLLDFQTDGYLKVVIDGDVRYLSGQGMLMVGSEPFDRYKMIKLIENKRNNIYNVCRTYVNAVKGWHYTIFRVRPIDLEFRKAINIKALSSVKSVENLEVNIVYNLYDVGKFGVYNSLKCVRLIDYLPDLLLNTGRCYLKLKRKAVKIEITDWRMFNIVISKRRFLEDNLY